MSTNGNNSIARYVAATSSTLFRFFSYMFLRWVLKSNSRPLPLTDANQLLRSPALLVDLNILCLTT